MHDSTRDAPAIELRPRSLGELLDVSLLIYRRNFVVLMTCELVVAGPLLVVSLVAATALPWILNTPSGTQEGTPPVAALFAVLAVLLLSIATPLKEGALMHITQRRLNGRTLSVRWAYRSILSRWLSLWIAGALQFIPRVLILALFAFISALPSLIELLILIIASGPDSPFTSGLGYFLTPTLLSLFLGIAGTTALLLVWLNKPAIVIERLNVFRANGHAYSLSKRWRFRLAIRLLVSELLKFVGVTLPLFAIEVLLALSLLEPSRGATGIELFWITFVLCISVSGILSSPFTAIYVTMNYLDLRIRKEHFDLELRARMLTQVQSLPPAEAPISNP